MSYRTVLRVLLLLTGLQVIGCNRAVVDAPNPIPIAAGEYHRIFDASVRVLRDENFIVNRRDRRFGVVTTYPLDASTAFEPWDRDNSTPGQSLESTLLYQRRTVRVEIHRIDSAQPGKPDPAREAARVHADLAQALADPRAHTDANAQYELQVIVTLERRHHPPAQLVSSAVVPFDYRKPKPRYFDEVTESGVEGSYWLPAGRDPLLEKRLLAAILRRATFDTNPTVYDEAHPKNNRQN